MNLKFVLKPLYSTEGKSRWEVLAELLKNAERFKGCRVEQTRHGFIASWMIPGDEQSGGVYIFDERAKQVFIVYGEDGRGNDYSSNELAQVMPALYKSVKAAERGEPVSSDEKHSFKPNRPHRRHRHQRHTQVSTARPAAAVVA